MLSPARRAVPPHRYRDAILGRVRLTATTVPCPGGGTSLPNLDSTRVGFAAPLCCIRTCTANKATAQLVVLDYDLANRHISRATGHALIDHCIREEHWHETRKLCGCNLLFCTSWEGDCEGTLSVSRGWMVDWLAARAIAPASTSLAGFRSTCAQKGVRALDMRV